MTHPVDAFSPAARVQQRLGGWLAGKWRLDAVLGAGGMGVVYEARHRNGKRVAIKVLHPELMVHGDVLKRFLREGYLANAVEHPGVVSVLDDGVTDEGVPYMVMEYLEGENLDARLTRIGRPLLLEDALAVGVAMLEVLDPAHERGIVHRDIKPENVFLTSSGGVKLLDFGIAYLLDNAGGMASTRPGIAVGTPTFMPREQAQGLGGLVDGQSDLWSVGATLYFALTNEFLYEARSVSDFINKLMSQEPRPLREMAPSVPEPIARVIHQALQHDRSQRWPSAGLMKVALQVAAKEVGLTIPASPSQEGYSAPALRNSLVSLSDELEANLAERLSIPFPKPISSNPPGPPGNRLSTPPEFLAGRLSTPPEFSQARPLTPARDIHSDTMPGVPASARSLPTEEPPPSSRLSVSVPPRAMPSEPPPPSRWRLAGPLIFGAAGLLVGALFLGNRTPPASEQTAPSMLPVVSPSSSSPVPEASELPSPDASVSAPPVLSASAAPSHTAPPAAASIPLKQPLLPKPPAPLKTGGPPKSAGGDDLGSTRE